MKWFWGLLIIGLGIFFLGVNFAWWSALDLNRLVDFWPLILVFLGLVFIFKNWRFGWILILLALFFIVFLVYNSVTSRPKFTPRLRVQNQVKTIPIAVDMPSDVTSAEIHIETGAVNFHLRGNSDKLISGEMRSSFVEPKVTTSVKDNIAIVDITTHKLGYQFGAGKNELDLVLTNNLPIALDIDAGAASLDFDFSSIQLKKFNLKAGASSIKMTLGEKIQNNANINIDAGASSIELEIPQKFGVNAVMETGLTSKNFQNYTKIDNNTYHSNNYDAASERLNLNFKTGASSIRITSL